MAKNQDQIQTKFTRTLTAENSHKLRCTCLLLLHLKLSHFRAGVNTVGRRAFALHMANPGLIPSTPEGSLSTARDAEPGVTLVHNWVWAQMKKNLITFHSQNLKSNIKKGGSSL